MTALYVFLSVLLLLVLIFSVSITVYVSIKDEIKIEVGALGIRYRAFLSEEKPKKKKEKEKPEKEPQKEAEQAIKEKKPNEKSFSETVDFVLKLFKSVFPNAVGMLKRLRFLNIRIYMSVACDDAADTAIRYGEANAMIMSVLAALSSNFKTTVKACKIRPDFVRETSLYDISFKCKLRLCHVLFAACGMLGKFIKNFVFTAKKGSPARAEENKNQKELLPEK